MNKASVNITIFTTEIDTEHGDRMFLRNVGINLSGYMKSQPRSSAIQKPCISKKVTAF
jgi:hypothetical protein